MTYKLIIASAELPGAQAQSATAEGVPDLITAHTNLGAGIGSYQVQRRAGVTLLTGLVPIDDFQALCGQAKDAVLSPRLAQLLGCSFAWGSEASVKALEVEVLASREQALGSASELDRWIAIGEHGCSSLAMFQHLTGRHVVRYASETDAYPRDPSDLSRCRKLLEQCPSLQPLLPRMEQLSPVWAALVSRWRELCDRMDGEAPEWRSNKWTAPGTYQLMRQLIDSGEQQ